MAGLFLLSVVAFYWVKKISQPALDPKYAAYKSLSEGLQSQDLVIVPLLDAGADHTASQPYYLEERDELVIALHYASSNRNAPLLKVFRVDRQARVIDSLDAAELSADNKSLIFDKGFIKPEGSNRAYSWVFDGTKTLVQEGLQDSNNKITALPNDPGTIRLEYFHKTAKLECGTGTDVKWNGRGYYQIFHRSDTISFKIDSLYTQNAEGECRARPVEYYATEGLDFALIRLDERSYYIVKPKKK